MAPNSSERQIEENKKQKAGEQVSGDRSSLLLIYFLDDLTWAWKPLEEEKNTSLDHIWPAQICAPITAFGRRQSLSSSVKKTVKFQC